MVAITITEEEGVFFATDDSDPPMFCAATSLSQVLDAIRRVAARVAQSYPVTVEAVAKTIWLAEFERAFSRTPSDPWENQSDKVKEGHRLTAQRLVNEGYVGVAQASSIGADKMVEEAAGKTATRLLDEWSEIEGSENFGPYVETMAFLGKENSVGWIWAQEVRFERNFDEEQERLRKSVLEILDTSRVAVEFPEGGIGPDDCAEHMLLQARVKGQEQWTNIYAAQLEHLAGCGCEVRAFAQAPSGPTLETKIRAVTRIPLIQIAADCHRSKWQFDMDRDELMPAAEARRLVTKAFNILHNIGDKAHKAAEALRSDAPTEGLVVSSTERQSHD